MKKILLTGAYKYSENQIKKIQNLGFEVEFHKHESDEIKQCGKYDAVVCNSLFVSHNIKDFNNLKYIQLTSAGYDRVPLEYIKKHNIEIRNARGVYSIPIAEHTVMLVLESMRNSRKFYENHQKHIWDKNRNAIELFGKTVVIAGCGSIGLEIAKRLNAFGMKIIGLDVYSVESKYLNECKNISELYKVAVEADIFISSIPYTKDTHHIFNAKLFSNMKENSVFINISRGKVVDETALIKSLQNKEIKRAALDVFEKEPISEDNELWNLDNLIITPHNSFVGDGNSKRMFEVIYSNLKEWLKT